MHLIVRMVFQITAPAALIVNTNVCRQFHAGVPSQGITPIQTFLHKTAAVSLSQDALLNAEPPTLSNSKHDAIEVHELWLTIGESLQRFRL